MDLTPTLKSTQLILQLYMIQIFPKKIQKKYFPNTSISGNDLTCMQPNVDFFKALKFQLENELMPHIKMFIKEELKENDLDNSNIGIIKSLEKEFRFLEQEPVKKNKLMVLHMSKILAHSTDNSNGNDFNLDTDLTTLNSKLVDKTIIFCSNKLD